MERFSEKVFLSLTMPTEDESLSDEGRIRLALQTLGYENVTVPLSVLRKLYPMCRDANFDITVTMVYRQTDWIVTDVEAGDTTMYHYGLCVDYGSTTIIMELVDLTSGAVIGREKEVNGQTAYGTDILTRITYALEDPTHIDDLQTATVQTFEKLLSLLTEQTGIDAAKLPVMIVSGNTTMVHFLLKLNAWTVFASPYAPVVSDPGWFTGNDLGMGFDGMVYLIPAASNYIGGDIVSGLLTLDLHKQDEISMFFDIGTNGELVLGNKDWIIAGAGAAGPALEGYISKFGMRAADGAIDTVKIEETSLSYTTIGNKKPVGICGSGIIDLLAQMRLHGWINIAGELEPKASSQIIWVEEESQYAVEYAPSLYFTQTDIKQYLDTKAAAYTMIQCILDAAGVREDEIAQCCLSGAFTAHSDLEHTITIGIFPDLPRERYHAIANTSLDGARTLLLDRTKLSDARTLSQNIYCIQFASIPDFLIQMQAAKFIPHTDMDRFPSIKKLLPQ